MACQITNATLKQLDIILNCNPAHCIGVNCELFRPVDGYCRAVDIADKVKTIIEMKFDGKNGTMTRYDPDPVVVDVEPEGSSESAESTDEHKEPTEQANEPTDPPKGSDGKKDKKKGKK